MNGYYADRIVAGRYRLEAPIGHGAFATVFSARHVHLGAAFALKVLRPAVAPDPEAIARFHREAVATARLRHPNIVDVVDFGEDAEVGLFLVMELLEGETLDERLARVGHLGAREAVGLAVQLADGLATAHAGGVVHRDVKPANVFLLPRRPTLPKLLDFGIAGLTSEGLTSGRGAAVTLHGELVGSPAYMSPEQARGERPAPAADIYALGVLLYEMCTGRRPFEAAHPVQILSLQLDQEPPPPSTIRPIPAAVEEVILRCLAKRPEDRPPDMATLRDELAAVARAVGAAVLPRPGCGALPPPAVTLAAPGGTDGGAGGGGRPARDWPVAADGCAVRAADCARRAALAETLRAPRPNGWPVCLGAPPSAPAPRPRGGRVTAGAAVAALAAALVVLGYVRTPAPDGIAVARSAGAPPARAALTGERAAPGEPGPPGAHPDGTEAGLPDRLPYRIDTLPSGLTVREAGRGGRTLGRTLGRTPLLLAIDPRGPTRALLIERPGQPPLRLTLDPALIAARGDDMLLVDVRAAVPVVCDADTGGTGGTGGAGSER